MFIAMNERRKANHIIYASEPLQILIFIILAFKLVFYLTD